MNILGGHSQTLRLENLDRDPWALFISKLYEYKVTRVLLKEDLKGRDPALSQQKKRNLSYLVTQNRHCKVTVFQVSIAVQ